MKSADGGAVREAIHKYTMYTRMYCNSSGLMQMHFKFEHYLYFLNVIAGIVKLKQNDIILDWGSGCGTMLNYFHVKYNTTGVGLDATEDAINFARQHSQPDQLFCHTDATRALPHFKSNTFHAIVSWAALYHVRRTLQQCETVNEMVRILKPGGMAFIGHLRTEKTQRFWSRHKCELTNGTYVKLMDAKTFHVPNFKRNGFFSIVVTKDP
jgi:ubiquinone/menaquinone biosynthesis C-methylase UbiE